MARNNVQTTVTVGMDVQLAKRNAEALKRVIIDLKEQLKDARKTMDTATTAEAFKTASAAVDELILKIKTLEKVQRSATPAAAYESFISGDVMNSNTLRQAQRGAKNRLNTVNEFASDKTARQFLDDIDKTQMRLNRLQAGFTKPLQSVKKELNDLSGGELQRLHQLLQQEQKLVQGNDKAWAAYSVAIGKVEERMREYDTLARQTMGAQTLSKSQKGGFAQANERDIERAIEKLREYRAVINDPEGTGKATWEATTREILKLQTTLDTLKQKTAELKGEAMSAADAEKIGMQALKGTFAGDSKQLSLAKKTLEERILLVKRGSDEYKRLQKAIQGCEQEEKRMGMTAKEIQAVLDQPKGKSYNELKVAVEQGRIELARMRTETDADKKKFDELAAKVKECDIQMKQLAGSAKGTASAFDKAWSRLKTYIGLYMGAAVAMQKLTGTFGDLMELSDRMGEVRKTTGFTAEEVGRLSESLKKLDTRTTINGLLDLSVAAGQLGLKTQEDVEGFTIAANKLMVALPEMGKEGATEMLKVALATGEIDKIRRQMEEGLIDGSSATAVAMEKVGSTIDRLRATSAATAPAITDFVKRVGAVGAQSGISIDQVAALGSTVDALGMRVEMSATALSRMIPAIRNNAFAIGQVIGKTEEYIRKQFAEGKGMNVILDIFDAIKKSGKQSADDIEAMFGGSMQEIMKELNQQGARAGIVFAGLSQNVDELRRQLGVAAKAYKENIAIQQEYDKMNETTAAKWERFKNQLEEFFVGDETQKVLGNIIDGLRKILDLLTDDGWGKFFRYTITYLLLLKSKWSETIGNAIMSLGKFVWSMRSSAIAAETDAAAKAADAAATTTLGNATVAATEKTNLFSKAWGKLNATMKANIIAAVATALIWLGSVLLDIHSKAKEAAADIGRFNQKLSDEQKALDKIMEPLKNSNLAQEERKKLIAEINSQYGKYLGYMLSETTSAVQLADAHALIAKRIREEAYERRIAEKERKIREEYDEDMNANYGNIVSRVRKGAKSGADVERIADGLKGFVDRNLDRIEKRWGGGLNLEPAFRNELNGFLERLVADGKLSKNSVEGVRSSLLTYMNTAKDQHDDIMKQTSSMRSDLRGIQGAIQTDLTNNLKGLIGSIANMSRPQIPGATGPLAPKPQGGTANGFPKPVWQTGGAGAGIGFGLFGGQQVSQVNIPQPGDRPKINENNIEQVREYVKAQDNLRGWLSQYAQTVSKSDREAAEAWLDSEDEVNRLRKLVAKSDATNPNSPSYNPYGNFTVMDSYDKWSADALVDRKKQMLQYVRAMANGADVQAILSQDKKFMDEATRKGIKNVRDAIEWYNSERLKIQEELADRHLTNEGGWANPAKAKGRKTRQPMSESAIAQLEEYYAWRKEEVERQRTEEGISEAEFNRRMEALEQEHLQKRADLRKTFTSQDKQYIEQFRKWWASVRELDEVEWELIDAEWKVAIKRDKDYNDMKAAKDLSAMRAIVVKQLNAIEDIIAKERPFNGITENLEANLTKMGILFADFDKMKAQALAEGKDTSAIDALYGTDRSKRLSFILGESENSFSSSVEEVMARMADAGMEAWAEEIRQSPQMQEALMAQLHQTYDQIQEAIKKEASLMKKQAETMWNNILLPGGDGKTTVKDAFEQAIAQLGIDQGRVSRANSLIGAGQASERVADRLAIKQMQLQLSMQEHYYNLMRKQGMQRIKDLERQVELAREEGDIEKAKRIEMDRQHVEMSLRLATTKEQNELLKQQEEIIAKTEESENRLYTQLKEWGDLLASSMRELMEASNAGNAEYYNELAKLNLTGKGGPGAGTYIVIDNEGTSDAKAHYEYLDERAALERQREIEQQNAQAEAWRKVMDDLNAKMNERITDWMNAQLQNQAVYENTDALGLNTKALGTLSEQLAQGITVNNGGGTTGGTTVTSAPADNGFASDKQAYYEKVSGQNATTGTPAPFESSGDFATDRAAYFAAASGATDPMAAAQAQMDANDAVTQNFIDNKQKETQVQKQSEQQMTKSSQATFAKMTLAANMYGVAYQAVSNENLSATQKFEMIALQAVGNYAISSLTTFMSEAVARGAVDEATVLGKLWSQLGWAAAPVFAIFTGLLGAAMGAATSAVSKSKSQIAQATGASASAGKLTTGMLTYAEGNVNEFTDPGTLTPGRQYNVDAADGRTYRARYMGSNPKTHLTNGPEFHLSGERGREMIIDAGTTRQITMNDGEIWHAIQTLSAGGRLPASRRRRGVRAFAEGNVDDFEEMAGGYDMPEGSAGGFSPEMAAQMQASLDRNSEVMERVLEQGIHAYFDVYGKGGLVDSYDTGKKTVTRHGERY